MAKEKQFVKEITDMTVDFPQLGIPMTIARIGFFTPFASLRAIFSASTLFSPDVTAPATEREVAQIALATMP